MKLAVLVLTSACTTLGPVPATTALSAIPGGSPGFEVQGGFVPAFFLSRSAQDTAHGAITPELSALIDPDRWLHVPGLIVGARVFGQSHDTPGEPYVGYRRKLDDAWSIAGIVFGTSKRSTRSLASYKATQVGGEALIDAKLWQPNAWLAVHSQAAVAATAISASGTYCASGGVAIDCNTDGTPNTMIDGAASGVFPSATGTLAVDIGRQSTKPFHGARIAGLVAAGAMPLVKDGVKAATDAYWSVGLTLTLGFGAD